MNDQLPTDPETIREVAKAAQSVSDAYSKTVDALVRTGSYVGETLGSLPSDIVGLLGGDRLKHERLRNWSRLSIETQKILDDRGVDGSTANASPNVVIPIAAAAADESREELQNLYARLLANASDPETGDRVRRDFIETVKKMEPLDARLFQLIYEAPTAIEWYQELSKKYQGLNVSDLPRLNMVANCLRQTGANRDELTISLQNLESMDCIDSFRMENGGNAGSGKLGRIASSATSLIKHKQLDGAKFFEEFPEDAVYANVTVYGRVLWSALER